MREEAEEKLDLLKWKRAACFPRPRGRVPLRAAVQAQLQVAPEVSGFVLAAASAHQAAAQLGAAMLAPLSWLKAEPVAQKLPFRL